MSDPAPADRCARVQRAACSKARVRWQAAGAPGGSPPASARPASSSNGPPRQARRLPGCPDPFLVYSRHAGCPPTPLILAGMSFVRARPSPFAPDWLPQGEPGALERVLGGIAGSCRSYGRAGPGVARPLATVRREKSRAPSPIRPCRGSVAWRTGLMMSPRKMIPRMPPRRCEINVLAGTRGLATRTPWLIGLLSRSPQITPPGVMPGWCAQRPGAATFDDSDHRIPAAAGPGIPRTRIRRRSGREAQRPHAKSRRHDGEEQVPDRQPSGTATG